MYRGLLPPFGVAFRFMTYVLFIISSIIITKNILVFKTIFAKSLFGKVFNLFVLWFVCVSLRPMCVCGGKILVAVTWRSRGFDKYCFYCFGCKSFLVIIFCGRVVKLPLNDDCIVVVVVVAVNLKELLKFFWLRVIIRFQVV